MLLFKVNFYATLRKITGTKTVEFSIPKGSTVRQLLEIVVGRFPEMEEKLMDQNGELDPHAHVYINGRNCPLLENGLDTNLLPNDTVDIFPIGHF